MIFDYGYDIRISKLYSNIYSNLFFKYFRIFKYQFEFRMEALVLRVAMAKYRSPIY